MGIPENDGPGDHTTVDSSPGGLMKTRGVEALNSSPLGSETNRVVTASVGGVSCISAVTLRSLFVPHAKLEREPRCAMIDSTLGNAA